MKSPFRLPLAACCLLFLCAGCSFFSARLTLRVHLPAPPPHWLAGLPSWEWRLCFPSPEGGLETRVLAAGLREASLTVPRQRNIPVSAAVVLSSGLRLPPAGGVHPLDEGRDAGTMDLSWEHGFLAELLTGLIDGDVEVAGLNSRRLAAAIWERSGGDPWRLDLNGMAQALAAADFTLYNIRLLPAGGGTISPGAGLWFLESPFARPLEADAEGSLPLMDLSLGRHALFSLWEESWYLLAVTAEDGVLMLPGEP